MTGAQLKAWRVRMGLKVREAAVNLGVSVDTYGRMEQRPWVPRHVSLACAAMAYGLPPME